ncbi:MAG TPA: SDR family NAD(P)-dependent oxidoreductase [Thermoplasmata archaeon]
MSSYFDGKSVFVTGAAGFVGSHLCRRLAQEGAHGVGADNLSAARPDWSAAALGGTFTPANVDLRRPEETKAVLEQARPDVVFHLAAVANPRVCKQDFPLAFDVNVLGLQNVLRYSPAAARFLFMSSAAVYGAPEHLPIEEAHPRHGSDPYSVTKIIGEDLVQCYAKNYARSVAIVRNFNSFGVGQTGDYIVPQLIRGALVDKKIEIWDATTVRDLMYIEDTIEALLAVAASAETAPINVGAGRGTTVGDLAAAISRRFGGEIPVVDLKKKVLGSPALVSNNERLRSLGWTEQVGFEAGIDRTIEWTRTQIGAPTAP